MKPAKMARAVVETVEGYQIGLAFAGDSLACNAMPMKSRRSALRDLHEVCLGSRGRIPLLLKRSSASSKSFELGRHIYELYQGRPSVFPEGARLYPISGAKRRAVLHLLMKVPRGRVTTYGEIARLFGVHPRVVGNYMAKNPFPLIIPCHRVVNSRLKLGGYSHGQIIKGNLLIREGVSVDMRTGKVDRSSLLVAEDLSELVPLTVKIGDA